MRDLSVWPGVCWVLVSIRHTHMMGNLSLRYVPGPVRDGPSAVRPRRPRGAGPSRVRGPTRRFRFARDAAKHTPSPQASRTWDSYGLPVHHHLLAPRGAPTRPSLGLRAL